MNTPSVHSMGRGRALVLAGSVALISSLFPACDLAGQAANWPNVAKWNFTITEDPFNASPIDVSFLNEDVAGQSGWVTFADGKFVRGDGEPLRFWAATTGDDSLEDLQHRARFMAKRGYNLVRWHTSVYQNSAASMSDVAMDRVNNLQRMVAAMKAEGIYVDISYFFILGLRINPAWGLEGYTKEWMDANPSSKEEAPFGLQYFDSTFRNAIKSWLTTILTTPSPYEDGLTLAQNRAVAIVEILNEDNLFFWTWNPYRFPPQQQANIFRQFGDFLKAKYGTLEAAKTFWGSGSSNGSDNLAQGLMGVTGAGEMAGNSYNKRMADQLEFYIKVQREFYEDITAHLRTLGYGGTVGGSNWTTADNSYLMDAEHYTYAGAGVIDSHNYFDPYKVVMANRTVGVGDSFYDVPVVLNPRSSPTGNKHVEGHPRIISETAWNNPTNIMAEGPLVTAAYCALTDIDGWIWFAYGDRAWTTNHVQWAVGTPAMMGQSPGAALLYRRGDVAAAKAVVREARPLTSLYRRESTIIKHYTGWDVTRDPKKEFNYDNETGKGQVDTAAKLVGRVDVAFEDGDDYVDPRLAELIDTVNKRITSSTGELVLDHQSGILTINTPRSQAAIGYLQNGGTIALDNVDIRAGASWDFGAILVIALDDQPLAQSSKILIQAFTEDHLTGWNTVAENVQGSPGERVLEIGASPWQVEEIDARVTFKNVGTITAIQVLNENGYQASNLAPNTRVTLPKNRLHTVLTLTPPADRTPVIASKDLPNARKGAAYSTVVEVLAGDAPLAWSVAAGSSLPDGLTLAADGTLAGTPARGGHFDFSLEVADADGDLAARAFRLAILPIESAPASIFVESASTVRYPGNFAWNSLGFLYDGFYPFVWVYGYNAWWYVFSGDTTTEAGGYYLYDFKTGQFGFTQASYYPYYFIVGGPNNGNFVLVAP